MAPTILVTGGTGYIGGSVLNTLATKHPEYEIAALLRRLPEGFASRYPNIKVINGDYDSYDIIAEAAENSDVVVHNGNSDHEPSLKALIAGLKRRASRYSPAFLIHLSGSGLVADWREDRTPGTRNSKTWSDIGDLVEIRSRPRGELHQNTEAILAAAAAEEEKTGVKIAVICPPDIYGKGSGPGKVASIFIPLYVSKIKETGRAFYAGEGENRRGWVHIEDLMQVYLGLVEDAVAGGKNADWGTQGYYFASSQEASQKEIATTTGKVLEKLGVITNAEPLSLPTAEIDTMIKVYPQYPLLGRYLFASNSRTTADRATKWLGYKPSAPSLWDTVEEDITTALAE
ncbi:NAD(P)-binding protein [Patellaria atrata CBS 101060]|uniref:NAD(P)-binding protein n=1 Tax=Patellaria atrata CBS 101060 TaxID=1346257 RepID=A0A9P4S421_9PEZI|nr:NAD(P)-binding protein [Patellaria atrata CBS 101060]